MLKLNPLTEPKISEFSIPVETQVNLPNNFETVSGKPDKIKTSKNFLSNISLAFKLAFSSIDDI